MPHVFPNANNANCILPIADCATKRVIFASPTHSRHDGSSHCEGFSLWYILIFIPDQVGDSVESVQISQTPDLGNFEDISKLGCNFVYSNSDPFFPLSGCVSCVMVLSPALAACNENLHSPLPANFCPWQPRLSVIFLLLLICMMRTGSQKAIGSWRNPSRGKNLRPDN